MRFLDRRSNYSTNPLHPINRIAPLARSLGTLTLETTSQVRRVNFMAHLFSRTIVWACSSHKKTRFHPLGVRSTMNDRCVESGRVWACKRRGGERDSHGQIRHDFTIEPAKPRGRFASNMDVSYLRTRYSYIDIVGASVLTSVAGEPRASTFGELFPRAVAFLPLLRGGC